MNALPNHLPSTTQTITAHSVREWESNRTEDHLELTLHSLEESTSLYSSMIDQDAIELAESTNQTEQRQNVLVSQLTTLVDTAATLRDAVKLVHREGTTLGSAGVTISVGLMSLLSGNLPLGIPVTAIGVNEIAKIIARNRTTSDASSLVSEARTGAALIRQLEEYQLQSLKSIDGQLETATEQLKATQDQLKQIEQLATHGSADVENKKQEAYKLTEKAVRDQQQAIMTIQNGKTKIEQTVMDLMNIGKQLENLITQAKERKATPEELDNFIQEIQGILAHIIKAQQGIGFAADNFNEGLKILRLSAKSYMLASEKFTQASLLMQTTLYEIQKKAQMDNVLKTQDHLSKARDEVAIAKERAQTSEEIASHVQENLTQLQEKVDNQWGTTSMVGGVFLGALVSPLGGVLVLPAAAAGAAAVHYGRRIREMASRRGQLISMDLQNNTGPIGGITVKYNENSTGWGGYLRDTALWIRRNKGVGSKTEGVIALNLGKDTPSVYSFNKNLKNTKDMMKPEDIKQLGNDLRKLVDEKRLSPEECLKILDSLSQVASENGKLCLISLDCLYLRDLRSHCRRHI
jgi:hypothetical protein